MAERRNLDKQTSSPGVWLVGLLVAVIAIGGAIYYFARGRGSRMSAEEARSLIQTKNVGLGLLENSKIAEGLASFESIETKLPGDPLAPRNVAVARVLALGVDFEPADEEKLAPARTALARLAEVEGESVPYRWLAMRLSAASGDFAGADRHLEAVLAQEPDNFAAWYLRHRLAVLRSPDEPPAEAYEWLSKAYSLSPSNVWLLVEWLRATARQINTALAALPDDEAARTAAETSLRERFAPVAEQLAAARPAVASYAYVIEAHARINPLDLLSQAEEGIRSGQLQVAATRMMILANVLLPHSTVDQQPLRSHPLEFVLDRFGADFYAAAQIGESEPEPAIPVKFAAKDAWQLPADLAQAAGPFVDFAMADFDLDGQLDVVALSPSAVTVFSRSGEGKAWQAIVTAALASHSREKPPRGLLVQDLDADFDETTLATGPMPAGGCASADVDVVVFGDGGSELFENKFEATSTSRTLVAAPDDKRPPLERAVQAAACGDLDADGDLDLALATDAGIVLWINGGEWRFVDGSSRAVLPEGVTDAVQLVPLDFDRDVDIDLLVAAPSGGGWLENLRHGQFRWRPFADDFPPAEKAGSLAPITTGEPTWNLLAAGAEGLRLVKSETPASGLVRLAGETSLAATPFAHVLSLDYDNDGADDVLAWSDERVELFRGLGDGRFTAVDLLAGQPAPQQIRVGDVDSDGDEDLVLLVEGQLVWLANDGGNANHWLNVALQAQQIKGDQLSPSGRVSPYGLGCLLEAKTGTRYQAKSITGQSTHFGLGGASEADVIRVGWLNGVPQNIVQPAANQMVCEQQVLNTSCPYLYAWNGQRFVFVTDLLWNAPLGLQFAEGVLAPPRDWEYLKIDGELLAPRDGAYELQLTAELWEADYFDEVKLIAVDHPADVAIYSNEKVGPAEMAAFKIHTVRQPHIPAKATTSGGRDILPELAQRDEEYATPYEQKLRQGVTADHYFELDLGPLAALPAENRPPVTLFLAGWVYPAATSINVALSQGGSIPPPVPPSLEVPDGKGTSTENGGWRVAMPFLGFPGGKTKTIAIDLTPHLAAGDSRLRIRTTMEFYWDHAFFTVGEQPGEVRTTELPLLSADLHERGFSRVVRDGTNRPEQFFYDDVSTAPKWPPMAGRFTRLGDVRELLLASDDKLLVMGAGDETTVRFAVPNDPLPAGWKRDFLLYSVGWDKDANLQTVVGQSSEPLPFRAMNGYPWPPDEPVPDSAEYREYLRTYQTREANPAYWRELAR
jgi:hypothetical protein